MTSGDRQAFIDRFKQVGRRPSIDALDNWMEDAMTSGEQPIYEYRVGFTLNQNAPRGAGTYWRACPTLQDAERYVAHERSDEQFYAKRGRPATTDAMWIERRQVAPWEKVEQ